MTAYELNEKEAALIEALRGGKNDATTEADPDPQPVPYPCPVPTTTVRPDDDPHEPYENLRLAFAIAGALVAGQYVEIDLNEGTNSKGWWNDFDVLVTTISATLNVHLLA